MSISDKAQQIKADYQSQLDKLEQVKGELQGKLSLVDEMVAQADQEVLDAKNAGIEEGKAMIQLPDPTSPDAQYTQAQMNDAVNAGMAQQKSLDDAAAQAQSDALNGQLASAQQQASDLQAQLDAERADRAAEKQADADKLAQAQALIDSAKA